MAMQATLWSINALSCELGMDRRTLASRLTDLPPAKVDGKFKLWRLRDVLQHLEVRGRSTKNTADLEIEEALRAHFIEQITGDYLPKVFVNIIPVFLNLLVHELGLTKAQAIRTMQFAFLAFSIGTDEYFGGKYQYKMPDYLEESGKIGIEKFIGKRWPGDILRD